MASRSGWYRRSASHRRAMGLGRFITREELVREEGRSLDALLRARVPGLRIWDVGSARIAGSARGNISL